MIELTRPNLSNAVVVRPGSDIKNVGQLAGKTVGAPVATSAHYTLASIAQYETGKSLADLGVKLVYIPVGWDIIAAGVGTGKYDMTTGLLVSDERLKVVPPAFDTRLFRPAKRKDTKLVLRASACLPQNAVAFIVHLAKRVPEYRVVLALARGTGMEKEVEAIQTLKAEIGSPVELLIDVQRPEMAALFEQAGIYVHSATQPGEAVHKLVGAPVSIAEAMATGAYVLVRDVPALKRYVGDAGAAYGSLEEAAALIRATRAWSEAQWRQARLRAVERAFEFHADEIVLRPLFDDWCAIARERHAARAPAPPAA